MSRPTEAQTMFAAVNLRNVPLPGLPALLDRLTEAGWTWEANRDSWTTSFRKVRDRRSSQDAGSELQALVDDHLGFGEHDRHGAEWEIPEQTRELKDVTILARETSPGRFEASFRPTSPTHPARHGFTVDTKRGVRGKTLAQVLAWAERYWRQNYPDA